MNDSKHELQEQLTVVNNFGYMNDLKYNATKKNFIVFNRKRSRTSVNEWNGDVKLGADTLAEVDSMKYLGYHICNKNTVKIHIGKRKVSTF